MIGKNYMEIDSDKRLVIGDKVEARHRIDGLEMPERRKIPGSELSALFFVEYCEGGVVRITGFDNGRKVVGCDRCEYRQMI